MCLVPICLANRYSYSQPIAIHTHSLLRAYSQPLWCGFHGQCVGLHASVGVLCAHVYPCVYVCPHAELIDSTIAEGHAVLVHCGGGKGRAGTVLACYTVSQGLDPLHPHTTHTRAQTLPIKAPALAAEQAVRHIRATRPGSIETEQQRRFVGEWAKHAWKVYTKAEQEQEQEQADAQDTHVTAAGAGAGGVKQQGVGGSTSVTLPGNSKPSTPPRKGSNTAGPSKAQSHASVSGWSAGGSGSGSSQGQVSDVGSSKASTAQRKGDSTAGPSKAQSHATVSAGGSRPSQGQEPDSATGTSRVAGSGSSQGQGSEGGSPGVTSVGEYPRTPHLPWSPKVGVTHSSRELRIATRMYACVMHSAHIHHHSCVPRKGAKRARLCDAECG